MRRYIPGAACWGSTAPKLPVHRRSPARCTSRRWRLLACPYWAGRGRPAGRPSESARLPQAVPPPACGWWVSALFKRVGKENGAPRSSPDAPASVPSCWLITAFPACVILPQMNHQPMCIWMVKPPFTQYISRQPYSKQGDYARQPITERTSPENPFHTHKISQNQHGRNQENNLPGQ